MRAIVSGLVVLTLVSGLAVPAAADEARPPEVRGLCADDEDAPLCLHVLKTIMADYRKARRGDYQGMRNVAYCQWVACYGVVTEDKRSSCAWRRRIIKSPRADRSDEGHLARCCEKGY